MIPILSFVWLLLSLSYYMMKLQILLRNKKKKAANFKVVDDSFSKRLIY